MKKSEAIQEKLQGIASKVQENKYISAITNGLIAALPVSIVGAIGGILNALPIQGYQDFLVATRLKEVTPILTMVTTNLLALYVVFLIAMKFAEAHKTDGVPAGLLALMSFLIITPLGNVAESISAFISSNNITLAEGVVPTGSDFLPLEWLGAAGLFSAFIVALSTAKIYVTFKQKGWTIKMPDGVPPTVSKSFSSLVPGIVIGFCALALRFVMILTPFGSIHAAIFKIIAAPLANLGGSIVAMFIAILVAHILWICGVHGTMVIYSVFAGIWYPLQMANLAAFNANEPIPNLVSMSLFAMVLFMGAGGTVGLVVLMIRGKADQHRVLGKLAIIPNLFGINEPVLFGLPIIMNFTLAIPFILMPLLTLLIAYIGLVTGILPYLTGVSTPLGTPIIISGLLGGGWKWAVFQLLMMILSYFVYLPFFKIADKMAYEKELSAK